MVKRQRIESSNVPLSAFAVRQLTLNKAAKKKDNSSGKKRSVSEEESQDKYEDEMKTEGEFPSYKHTLVQVVVPGVDHRTKLHSESSKNDSEITPDINRSKVNPQEYSEFSVASPQTISPSLPLNLDDETVSENVPHSPQSSNDAIPVIKITEENSFRVKDTLYVGLHKDQKLAMVGTFIFRSVRGKFQLFGATYSSACMSWFPLNAPLAFATPVFSAIDNALPAMQISEYEEDSLNLRSFAVPSYSPKEHEYELEPKDILPNFETVIAFRENENGLSKIARVLPFAKRLFSFKNLLQDASSISNNFEITPESWCSFSNQLLFSTSKSDYVVPRLMVCGPKGSGKSSFSRYITNRLLQQYRHIAYLDLDPGQPEVVPSGHISLYYINSPLQGPVFARMLFPTYMLRLHLGDISPQKDPDHYIACVTRLFAEYKDYIFNQEISQKEIIPLIINCPGWIRGGGAELLSSIVDICQPTEVVYMSREDMKSSHREKKSIYQHKEYMPDFLSSRDEFQLTLLESTWQYLPDPNVNKVTSADNRMLGLLSYLYFNCNLQRWDFTTSLTACQPIATAFKGSSKGIDAVNIIGEPLNVNDVAKTINGTLMALYACDTASLDNSNTQRIVSSPEGIPLIINDGLPLNPNTSHCLGLIVLRTIDLKRNEFHFVGPLNLELIKDAYARSLKIVLERGRLELPVYAMLDHRLAQYSELPYLDRNHDRVAVGAHRRRVRRNIIRRSTFVG
ncbi:Polynucleotide 5''-hydroxyl-kinase grc3 [Schizosaccharomyces pombe]